MTPIEALDIRDWQQSVPATLASLATDRLEAGAVLRLPLGFALDEAERPLLETELLSGERKNISYNPATGRVKGAADDPRVEALLTALLSRYSASAHALAASLFPAYRGALLDGRASYRPAEIAGREPKSWRHDDTRLHVDAFPATPIHGKRLLRLFTNINPHGEARHWRVGENFAEVAARFYSRLPAPNHVKLRAMALTRITKSIRSDGDHYMLQLHDAMKADLDYQRDAQRTAVAFAPGETWIVYSDQVSHAVLSGRFLLEQTFYVPVRALQFPERSPLRVLEKLVGRSLVRGA